MKRILALLFFFFATSPLLATDFTLTNGQHLQGDIIELTDDHVILKKSNGSSYRIAFNQLDQQTVENLKTLPKVIRAKAPPAPITSTKNIIEPAADPAPVEQPEEIEPPPSTPENNAPQYQGPGFTSEDILPRAVPLRDTVGKNIYAFPQIVNASQETDQ